MIFYVEEHVDEIVGWILPDNPASIPSVVVIMDHGRRTVRLESNMERPDLKNSGFHNTGQCGFVVKPETCEGYEPGCAVEVYEADSNILMYRRGARAFAPVSLYHLETQTFPVYPLARALSDRLRMIYANVEFLGDQSRSYLTHVPFDSMLISGSALYMSMRPYIKPHFLRCVLFSDPLREIASRLLLAKALGGAKDETAAWRTLGMADLIEAVDGIALDDSRAVSKALGRMSDESFYALANPTTRKLVAKLPEDRLTLQHLGGAFDSLAEFDIIGFDDDLDSYRAQLGTLLDLDAFGSGPEADPPDLAGVMTALETVAIAQELVDLDRSLVATAKNAARKVDDVDVTAVAAPDGQPA